MPAYLIRQGYFHIHPMRPYIFLSFIISVILSLSACQTKGEQHDHNHEHQHNHEHSHDSVHDHDHEHGEACSHEEEEPSYLTEEGDEIYFSKSQAETAGIEVEEIELSPFGNIIKASGQIQAPQGEEQVVVSTVAGVVSLSGRSIVEGMTVRSGEALATVSAKNLQDGDPLQKAKIAFEAAEKEYRRSERLISEKIISSKEFEQARLNYETARVAYQGQAGTMTARGVTVLSPMQGYVKQLMVSHGEYVSVGQPIAVISQSKRLQLRAELSELHYKHLNHITNANFKTTYGDETYKLSELNGKLLSRGKAMSNGAPYVSLTFEFDNIGEIIPGSFVEVFLSCDHGEEVLSVPVSALVEEQGLYFVFLQKDEEHYMKQEVVPGQSNGVRTEILKGLSPGQKVVARGAYRLKLASATGVIPHDHNH